MLQQTRPNLVKHFEDLAVKSRQMASKSGLKSVSSKNCAHRQLIRANRNLIPEITERLSDGCLGMALKRAGEKVSFDVAATSNGFKAAALSAGSGMLSGLSNVYKGITKVL